jgi:SPP1 family predicted phage head-tail adaptor
MRAGKLDTIVSFQSVTNTVDGMGGTIETWAALSNAPTRAGYIPLRGTEKIEADKLTEKVEFKLKIRRDDRIGSDCRVTVRGDACKIISVEDYGRAGDMVLWCRVDK